MYVSDQNSTCETQCPDNRERNLITRVCDPLSSCGEGKYLDDSTSECLPCHSTCKYCNGYGEN
jgi:hypothetical protein